MYIQDFCNLGDVFTFVYETNYSEKYEITALAKSEILNSNKDFIFVFPVKFKYRTKNIKPIKIEENKLYFKFTPKIVGVWNIFINEDGVQKLIKTIEVV